MDSNELKMTDEELRALVVGRINKALPQQCFAMAFAFVVPSAEGKGIIVHTSGGLNPGIVVPEEGDKSVLLDMCDKVESLLDGVVHGMRENVRALVPVNKPVAEQAANAEASAEFPVEDGPMAVEAV